MVVLMLDAAAQQILGFQLKPLTVAVLCAHLDSDGAGHGAVMAREGQTALVGGLLFLGYGQDLRVHKVDELVLVIFGDLLGRIYTGTLVNALLYHCHDELSGINGKIRPGIVHRLDKDTSGVMIVAKNDFAHNNLALQIGSKSATKEYLALVHGNITEEKGIINANIGRHPIDRKKMAVVTTGGKPATTVFHVLERYKNCTLVQCKLLTGRTHQIRVHMAYIGHPLIGDPKYCNSKNKFNINGQALHSLNLKIKHPRTNKEMTFTAPIPEDMQALLKYFRQTI